MAELELSTQMEVGRLNLQANEYPGRIAIMGWSEGGDLAFQAYALMGRSPGSRNRIFVNEGTTVRTTAPGKTAEQMAATEMAELIYYPALKSAEGVFVVSNGAQTEPVLDSILAGNTLDYAVKNAPIVGDVDLSKYEPDGENSTPRITGVIDLREDAPTPFGLAVVRRAPNTEEPIYSVHELSSVKRLMPGQGFGIQTYNGNGEPLPSFDQDPYPFPLGKNAVDTTQSIWSVLNADNRVALVVRAIDLETRQIADTRIINTLV